MPLLLAVRRVVVRSYRLITPWQLALLLLAVAFVVGWTGLAVFEPPDNKIADAGNYWWFFDVTAKTIGYGDFFPTSTGGRITVSAIGWISIAAGGALAAAIIEGFQNSNRRKLKGLVTVDVRDHFVIYGHHEDADRTRRLITELRGETDRPIVLCAPSSVVGEHPFWREFTDVDFVRGDYTDDSTAERVGLSRARAVIVDIGVDATTVAVALWLRRRDDDVHIVAGLVNTENYRPIIECIPGTEVEAVQWYMPRLVAEAAKHPRISHFYRDLMSTGGVDTNTFIVPSGLDGMLAGELKSLLDRHFTATPLQVQRGPVDIINPPSDYALATGDTVVYMSAAKVDVAQLATLR